jgi:hypothetical protein
MFYFVFKSKQRLIEEKNDKMPFAVLSKLIEGKSHFNLIMCFTLGLWSSFGGIYVILPIKKENINQGLMKTEKLVENCFDYI